MPALPSFDMAVFNKLDADTALDALVSDRIYKLQAPPGVALPYLIYYRASGLIPNASPRDDANLVYRVDAVAESEEVAAQIQQAAYACLHEQNVTITGWTCYWLACERLTSLFEDIQGNPHWREIGDYRLKASISS